MRGPRCRYDARHDDRRRKNAEGERDRARAARSRAGAESNEESGAPSERRAPPRLLHGARTHVRHPRVRQRGEAAELPPCVKGGAQSGRAGTDVAGSHQFRLSGENSPFMK